VALGSLAWILEDIVIIRSEQLSRSAELTGELSKVEVDTPAVISQSVIKIASINEYCHSFFHAASF